MIYSKRHAKSEHLVGYKGIVSEVQGHITCPYIPMIYKVRCEGPVLFDIVWFDKTNISLVPKDNE